MKDLNTLNEYRRRHPLFPVMGSERNGYFQIPVEGRLFHIIASTGVGWDHVSVSIDGGKRTPNWGEMCKIKDMFFNEEETVVQFHPKKSEYVNNHPNVLHLWRRQDQEHELPPSLLTGVKELGEIK